MAEGLFRVHAPRSLLLPYVLASGAAVALRTCLAVVAGAAIAELAAGGMSALTVVLLSSMVVAAPATQAASSWLAARLMTSLAVDVRARLAAAITRKPYSFFVHAGHGPLHSRLMFDVQEVLTAYLQVRTIIVQTVTTAGVVVALSAFAVFNPLLALPLTIAVLCCVVLIRLWIVEIRRRAEAFSDAYGGLVESVTVLTSRSAALDSIVFDDGARVRTSFAGVLAHHQKVNLRRVRAGILAALSIEAVGALAVLSTLGLGAILHREGVIGVGEVAAGALLAITVMAPVSTLSQQLMESSGARSNLLRLGSLERDVGPPAGSAPDVEKKPSGDDAVLSLEGVDYSYDAMCDVVPGDLLSSPTAPSGGSRRSAVRDIDLTISRAERVGLTGESGSGKSTVGLLAAGIVQGACGTTRRHGCRVILLGSEVSPFVGDLASFLAPAGDVDDSAMWAALEDVDLASTLRERRIGLDSTINPAQGVLSVGQLRRLAVARGLTASPDLLILDETLSNLEPELVLSILESIERRGCAVLLVTHDRRHLAMCDRVVRLDRGRIGAHVTA